MMSIEKDCKWHFGNETGREQLSDPMSVHFENDLYTSLVRESIQNSLDAVIGTEQVRGNSYISKSTAVTFLDTKSTFYAFVRAIGVTVKDDTGA